MGGGLMSRAFWMGGSLGGGLVGSARAVLFIGGFVGEVGSCWFWGWTGSMRVFWGGVGWEVGGVSRIITLLGSGKSCFLLPVACLCSCFTVCVFDILRGGAM